MPLVDRANNILPLLLAEERLAQGDIAFVAHSFGGLILQQLLRVASDRSTLEPSVSGFVKRVNRIAFLGTPHRGADLATWAQILRLFVRPSSVTNALARNDPNLRGLNQWFRAYAIDSGIETLTLTETRKTFFSIIVPPDSADAGLLSDPIPIDADHFGIASPTSRDSEVYVHIRNFLRAPISPRSRNRLFDNDKLQQIAVGTGDNTAALQRIERTLEAGALSSVTPVVIPRELVDAEAERRLSRLRKSRFFVDAKSEEQASRLATDLLSGDLALASDIVKVRGLAWCARLLLGRPDRTEGQKLARAARQLATTEEVAIAEAFEQSYAGDLNAALATLSKLESPAARSASFFVSQHTKGANEALDWFRHAGLTFASLDADGKYYVIFAQLDSERFDDALSSCAALDAGDFEQTPALFHVAASANLASVVPRELAASALSQPPSVTLAAPLADDLASLARRRRARDLYAQAAIVAAALNFRGASYDASDRALALRLRDPNDREGALNELEQSMRTSEHSLRRLPLALQSRIKLDLEAVEQEIDRQVTLSGGGSQETALARLAIAQTKNPQESASYVEKYRDELARHVSRSFLAHVEIGALVESGQLQFADERFTEIKGNLTPTERDQLSLLIDSARESDPVASRESQFAATDALPDLALLVDMLERKKDWLRLSKYAEIFFQRTRDVPTCALYARSLFETGDFHGAATFLRSQEDFVNASEQLQALLAWSLYSEGNVNACRDILSRLRAHRDTPEDRVLTVNLAVTSGNWNALAGFVEQEWERRSERNAEELLGAGQIAQRLGSGRARELIVEAAAKGLDNPHVLLGCYSTAMGAGWEDEGTFTWLERAAALSDVDGPVQRVTLKEIVDRHPDWQRREAQAWEQFNAGLVPMVACGKMLNHSLIDMLLLPALLNMETVDPRRRQPIYCYSGSRRISSGQAQSIAIDPTALLTAGMLGLLDGMLNAVATVIIPHSTLPWLFEDRQRIRPHQPNRMADAHEIKRLLDTNVLQQVEPTAPVDEDFAAEVGQDLASLFAEAEADWGADRRPRLVVRSGPVHRAASLMEEEVDLGPHARFICGCLDVVEALVRQGRLTRAEEQRARAFLKLHETAWTSSTSVASGTVLYLDGLSVSHFQHLGVLSKFEASGFTVMISTVDVDEIERRIRYEALAVRADAIVEHIRGALSDGIANGKVVLAPTLRKTDTEESPLHHPAFDVVRAAALADVAIIDDRFFNQHANISHDDGSATPIRTSLDMLATLQLTEDDYVEYITRMRSAGLAFVPIKSDELGALLARATIDDGLLVETAELKALRENLQLCRMSQGLQVPHEGVWLEDVAGVLTHALKAQWGEDTDVAVASARSTWLMQQLDVRGWLHRFTNEHGRGIGELRFRAQLVALMTLRAAAPMPIRQAYWEWLDETLLDAIRDQEGDIYRAVVEDVSQLVKGAIAHHQQTEHGDAD
jgi:hypothetical protein